MSFADAYRAHRTPDGFLKPDVFDGLPHASRVHAQSQRMWRMPDRSSPVYHVLDLWLLHPGATITMQIASDQPGMYTQCVRLTLDSHDDQTELPLYSLSRGTHEPSELGEGGSWWAHPLARGWSPLKWWLANRPEDAKMFVHLCNLHMTPWDWHKAGLPPVQPPSRIRVAPSSALHRLLHIAAPQRPRTSASFGSDADDALRGPF